MLQQVMTKPGEIIFREVPVPEVKDDQVLVKIMNIGICGSDIHVYHGKHPFTKYPVTQGHEVSGEIVELGANVTGFHKGQKITIEPQVYCGHCYPCRHGKYNLCNDRAAGSCSSRSKTDGRCERHEYCSPWSRSDRKPGGTGCQRNGSRQSHDHRCQ